MSTSCRCDKFDCTVLAVVASLVIGIITAFLRITGTIELTPAFLWVLLGVATVYLAVSLVSSALFRGEGCDGLCNIISTLLAGILGTILLSVILLAIEFVATSIVGAILTGALLFFFSLTVTSTACNVKCFLNCNE